MDEFDELVTIRNQMKTSQWRSVEEEGRGSMRQERENERDVRGDERG